MQRRTYPFAFVILSPGSKIGHTPRKNPSAPMGAAATSRINAYRGWCRTPVLHQPFAAKKYDTTIYRKLQVFFQQIVKYFLKNSAFCRNSLSRPFPAFPLWGYHLLPWYIIHVPAQKSRVVSRIFCLAWYIFCCPGVVGIFGEEMLSFGAVRVSRERNSLYQGMFIFFSYLIYKEQRLGTMQTSSPTNYLQRSQHATRFLRGGMRASRPTGHFIVYCS